MGAGAVLGGLSVASRRGVSYKRLITLSMTMGVTILVAAVAPTLATEAVALFVMGASAFAFIAVANTTIQLTAAPEMRGRVMALYAIAFLGSTPIGGPIVGWISQQYGPRVGFAIGGVAAIGATAGRRLVARRDTAPARVSADRWSMAAPRAPGAAPATAGSSRRCRRTRVDAPSGIEAELAAGPALPEQVPALVERHFELLQAGRVVIAATLAASALPTRAR